MSPRERYRVYLMLMLLIVVASATAQNITNQTNIYVSPDLEVYIDGDIINEGFLQHQGAISFTGNWVNTNIYQGNGVITVAGTGAQSISNNQQSFSSLVINGTGSKRVIGLLPVTDNFELLSGVIVTTTQDTLLLSPSALVSGGSESSYVDGPLFSEGVGYKFFPIGKNGNYNPIEFSDITGINPRFSVEVFENVPTIEVPPRIDYFSSIYWQRTTVSGSFGGSPITVHYDLPDRYTDAHQVEILQSESLKIPFTKLNSVSVTPGTALDKISTDDLFTNEFLVIGNSIPIGGVEGEFYFSSALSPKATQQENRTIKIFGNQLMPQDFVFQVYNRWGLLIFESSSLQEMIDKGWNGTSRNGGDIVPAGAYPYRFKAKLTTGEAIERKGIITVVY